MSKFVAPIVSKFIPFVMLPAAKDAKQLSDGETRGERVAGASRN